MDKTKVTIKLVNGEVIETETTEVEKSEVFISVVIDEEGNKGYLFNKEHVLYIYIGDIKE